MAILEVRGLRKSFGKLEVLKGICLLYTSYYVREGFSGIFSHGFMSIAAITIIAACLLITGSFSLVAVNIEYNLSKLMAENEFLAYVDDSLSEDQARALQSQIEAVDNVATVTFISRDRCV